MRYQSVLTLRVNDWHEARILADKLHGWTFRGQQDASWPLTSTLQRAGENGKKATVFLTGNEQELIEQFQRRAHHFLQDPPPLENQIEWMALIQHFGGTTRLLDCTKSFYVAAFFAVERASTECAIWCVNHYALILGLERFLKIDTIKSTMPHWQVLHRVADLAQKALKANPSSFERILFEVQPFKLNERLAVQQGLFLCPISVDIPFMDSLTATFGMHPSVFADSKIEDYKPLGDIKELLKDAAVIKLLLPRAIHHDVLLDLWNMNVNAATLFPGLDGLARSLNYHVRIDQLWDIKCLANPSAAYRAKPCSEFPRQTEWWVNLSAAGERIAVEGRTHLLESRTC
jgi:hypothetical protein